MAALLKNLFSFIEHEGSSAVSEEEVHFRLEMNNVDLCCKDGALFGCRSDYNVSLECYLF